MSTRSDFPSPYPPDSATPTRAHQQHGSAARDTVLDFGSEKEIDLARMTALLAQAAQCRKHGIGVRTALPTSGEVQSYLERKRFYDVLSSLTDSRDHSVSQLRSREGNRNRSPVELLEAEGWLSLRYFSICSSPRDGWLLNLRTLLKHEDEYWNGSLIRAYLEGFIERSSYLASHIVYEAVTNAYRHSKATCLVIGSDIVGCEAKKPRHLDLSFWDDGEWIYETLQNALRSKKKILTDNARDVQVRFAVTGDTEDLPKDVSHDTVPLSPDAELALLICAFLPGVTSDPGADRVYAHSDINKWSPTLSQPGSGLFNLLNAACHIYSRGAVVVRAGKYVLRFQGNPTQSSASDYKYAFSLHIEKLTQSQLPIAGNIISVRIPLFHQG